MSKVMLPLAVLAGFILSASLTSVHAQDLVELSRQDFGSTCYPTTTKIGLHQRGRVVVSFPAAQRMGNCTSCT